MTSTAKVGTASLRDDPRYDKRRVIVYFVALVVFYAAVVAVVRPSWEGGMSGELTLGIMTAPTVGALAAVLLAHGRIQFGRPTMHLLLAFLPPAVVLLATWAVALVGGVEVHSRNLALVVALSPLLALSASLSAAGEEFGWRGFLWPLLRRRRGFGASAAVMVPIWWLYHLPVILLGGYGSVSGLPACTVAITGFTLFVCFLTERCGAGLAQHPRPRRVERPGDHGVLDRILGRRDPGVHARLPRLRGEPLPLDRSAGPARGVRLDCRGVYAAAGPGLHLVERPAPGRLGRRGSCLARGPISAMKRRLGEPVAVV